MKCLDFNTTTRLSPSTQGTRGSGLRAAVGTVTGRARCSRAGGGLRAQSGRTATPGRSAEGPAADLPLLLPKAALTPHGPGPVAPPGRLWTHQTRRHPPGPSSRGGGGPSGTPALPRAPLPRVLTGRGWRRASSRGGGFGGRGERQPRQPGGRGCQHLSRKAVTGHFELTTST